MLKKIRAAGEAVGVLVPSVADASKSAAEHQQALVAAQAVLEKAQDGLQAEHDRDAENPEVLRFEAAVAAAKAEVARAEGRYRGAEKRLAVARKAEAEKATAAAIVARDEALAIKATAAAEIARLMTLVAEQQRIYDSPDGALALAASAGVAARSPYIDGAAIVHGALRKAGVVPGHWQPQGAVELNEMARGAILAVQN